MEWEVLNVLRQSDHADNQLNKGVHKQHEVTHTCCCQCQHPKLHAVVELPTIDVLQCFLGQVVSYIS